MTLKGHYAPCFKTRASFGAHQENLNEDRLHSQWRRCSPMTLDSDDIRFMRIFAGVPWKEGVIRQWGNRKRVFSGFRTLRIRHLSRWGQYYYIVLFSTLSPFRWPQNTWLWVTLNGLNGHFTLYVHYYELPQTHYLLLIYWRLFITRDVLSGEVREAEYSKQWSAERHNICNLRKIFGSSVDAVSSEP